MVSRFDVGLRSERGPILLALMLSTALVAIDSTIIATAVPSIVKDIGGFAQFPWLFSIYLLAQAVTVPIYGKLADLFGRKPVMLFGIGLFLVGSIMCGIAWNMVVLIAFRAVQGLGAGAVLPMSHDRRRPVLARGAGQGAGLPGQRVGVSSVVGPTLGGVFSEYVSWRWIFFVNIPLCLLAAAMISRRFHEKVTRTRPPIDYPGAAVLTVGADPAHPRRARGRPGLGVGFAAERRRPRLGAALLVAFVVRRAPGAAIRCCRCGCSGAGCSSPAVSSRSVSARSCSGSARTSRPTCRTCSAPVRSSPASRWPR